MPRKTIGIVVILTECRLKYYNYLDYSMSKGARLFMLRPDGKQYNLFKLLNKEISFEVDVSKLPCGISADMKFVAMDSNGGFNRLQGNTAGAAYGTGYCDASCPRDMRFVNGQVGNFGCSVIFCQDDI
jgi:cellulose 1,4-beta-cellobiosidase